MIKILGIMRFFIIKSAHELFLFGLGFFVFSPGYAAASEDSALPSQIMREARCKVLIRGPMDVTVGEVLNISRRPNGQGTALGQVKILKKTDTRVTALVVDARGDCRRFLSAFVSQQSSSSPSLAQGRPITNTSRRVRSGPPPLVRLVIGAGPGLSNSTLRGVSREVVVENYPLVLTSLNISGDVYPLSFGGATSGFPTWLGIEGLFRYVKSSSDVQVTVPAPGTGDELKLGLAVNRVSGRGGVLLRMPLWKGRLFGDVRGGYYLSRLTSTVSKFENLPAGQPLPFEISPLRDLGLSGGYALAGLQFQPVNSFRARINVGTVLAPNYQIDNRLADAAKGSPLANAAVQKPAVFIVESNLGYVFNKLQLGLELSLENYGGEAFFPDGRSIGSMGESYLSYGFNLAFLL